MRLLVFACGLAIALTGVARADSVCTIRGTVVDGRLDRAIAEAEVRVLLDGRVLETRTDSRGAFALVGIPAGNVRLRVQANGYAPRQFDTCVDPGQVRTYAIQLFNLTIDFFYARPIPQLDVTQDEYTLGVGC